MKPETTGGGIRRGQLAVFILLGAGIVGAGVNVAHHWAGGASAPRARPSPLPADDIPSDDDEIESPKLRREPEFVDQPDLPDPPGPLEVFETQIAFSLIDHDGKPVTEADWRGRIWVCDFIYTYCSGPCHRISTAMSALQRDVVDPRVRFVSVSCDPKRDTPQTLREYGEVYQADFSRWSFLTGDRKVVGRLAKLGFLQGDSEEDPLLHTTKLMLVDGRGRMRGYYEGQSPNMTARLRRHIARLLAEEPPEVHSRPTTRETDR
jgi:protein SCO1/2